MIRKNITCTLISAFVMLGLPLFAISFIPGDGGMATCFLLFFAINPLLAIGTGIFSGKHLKTSWFQPVLCALFFVIGAWLFFNMGEKAFLLYAIFYLLLGYATAVIVHFAIRGKQ